jgi:hypothetical protein
MKRLLVVDDEPHVARVLRVSLAKDGWSVETAHDGPKPCGHRQQPRTMITDIQMPGMGGEELCRASTHDTHRPFPPRDDLHDRPRPAHWAQDLGSIEFSRNRSAHGASPHCWRSCWPGEAQCLIPTPAASPVTGAGSSAASARLHGRHRQQ